MVETEALAWCVLAFLIAKGGGCESDSNVL